MSDVLTHLGLRAQGGNDATIKRLIVAHSLDTSHFDVKTARRRGKTNYTYEQVFVERSPVPRSHLASLVRKFKVLPYACDCGNEGVWRGKELNLTVDHIDGVSDNNLVTNLRYLCPNCHSQTETFGGKNKPLPV